MSIASLCSLWLLMTRSPPVALACRRPVGSSRHRWPRCGRSDRQGATGALVPGGRRALDRLCPVRKAESEARSRTPNADGLFSDSGSMWRHFAPRLLQGPPSLTYKL